MRLPISEEELGLWYQLDRYSAFFYPINGSYYINHEHKYNKVSIIITSFKEFKKTYPILIYNNFFRKDI